MKAHELGRKLLDGPDVEVQDRDFMVITSITNNQVDDKSHPDYIDPPNYLDSNEISRKEWWSKCPRKTVITLD